MRARRREGGAWWGRGALLSLRVRRPPCGGHGGARRAGGARREGPQLL